MKKILIFLFLISCSGYQQTYFDNDAFDTQYIEQIVDVANYDNAELDLYENDYHEFQEEQENEDIVITRCPPDMALIDEGLFIMGSNANALERPVHTVYLDSYCIDFHEVTNKEYKECEDAGACNSHPINSNTREDYYTNVFYQNYPVVYIDWISAVRYCSWRDKRLPTEAEWEKAARGGCELNGSIYGCDDKDFSVVWPWSWRTEEVSCELMNYFDSVYNGSIICVGDTSYVSSLDGSSIYGVDDMSGNVLEWVFDYFGQYCRSRYDTDCIEYNPRGPSKGLMKVLRGGSCLNYRDDCRVSSRYAQSPSFTHFSIGIRCAKDL